MHETFPLRPQPLTDVPQDRGAVNKLEQQTEELQHMPEQFHLQTESFDGLFEGFCQRKVGARVESVVSGMC